MATTKTISATLSGSQNATGTKTGTLNGTWTGKAANTKVMTLTSGSTPGTDDYPMAPADSAALANVSLPAAYNYRSTAGSWSLNQDTTSEYTGNLIGNSYSNETTTVKTVSYSTNRSMAKGSTDNTYTLQTVKTATVTAVTVKSARTSYDRILTFAVSPSAIASATITITHASASSFPAYLAVVSSGAFLRTLSSSTYQSITLNGTSTTITLSSAMLTKLKNLGGDSILLNLGKYYPDGSVKSSYSGTLSVTAASMTYTLSTVTLSYNANEGSGAPSSASVTPEVAYTLSTTKPTRTGYTFKGWSTSSTASSATYQAGGSITISGDTTLYAVWSANTYTITYDKNGGTYASGAITIQSVVYSTTWTTRDATGLTKTGYTLLGWSTSSTATTATYSLGTSQSKYTTASNITLYAVWKIETYSITYKPDSYSSGSTYTDTKTYGVAITLRNATYTRPGYVQTGWTDNSTVYSVNASYTANAAATLYPVWTANTEYTVSLDTNGGTISNSSFRVHEGGYYGENFENYTLPSATWENKTFQGWYDKESGQKVTGLSIYPYTANSTLVAQWNAIPRVIIEVKKDGTTRLITGGNGTYALTM